MSAVIGLSRRSRLCKICTVFDDSILTEITLDILLQRRSWAQIREHYNKLLPKGISPITDVNLNNHKKHSNPELIAEEVLKRKEEWKSQSEIASGLYAEIFKEGLNKVKILEEIYRERLNNLKLLQNLLEDKKKDYFSLKESQSLSLVEKSLKKEIYNQIRTLTKDIDSIQSDLQDVLLKEASIDKGLSHGNIHITQNYVNVFQGHLKGFLEEIIPYLLVSIFKENPEKGRAVVKYISEAMDRHLAPALEESKLLTVSGNLKQNSEVISR